MPKFSGEYSKTGRPIWVDEKTNEAYSEKTRTIPVSRLPNGEPAPGTKWVNVPTVFDNGKVMDDEDFLYKFYKENKYQDPLTKEKLKMFPSATSAVEAAKKRSDNLRDQ